jgi:hypothetical protein
MPERLRWTGTQYRHPESGRYISRAAVRRALEESLANLTRRTDTLADDLRAGRLSLAAWQEEMELTIKQTQMAAAELAHGGRAQMTQADYGLVGQRVRTQYQFLDSWARQISAGQPVDNRMEGRARQYLRAARSSFLALEADAMTERGFGLVRSVLHASESCAECISESQRGYVPVGQMSLPGQRTCLSNCRCTLVYAQSAA